MIKNAYFKIYLQGISAVLCWFLMTVTGLILAAPSVHAEDLYWEEAALFSFRPGQFPISAHSENLSVIAWQEVTPNTTPGITAGGFINVNLAVKEADSDWQRRGIVAGPYAFLGTEPSILSMVIDNRERIIIAAAAGSAQTEILISTDKGQSFTRRTVALGAENTVAPRIFVRADGGYLLFVTRGRAQALSIYYSRSDDGNNWSPFEFFTPENTLSLNFLPTHASIGRRDIVFFQSLIMGTESLSTFQLFFKTSDDNGRTWSQARRWTTFNDPVIQTQAPADSFDNQRPHLTRHGNNLLLVWERRFSNQSPQIYSAIIDQNAGINGRAERVNNVDAYSQNPIGFIVDNNPMVVWFDNRSGNNRIILAQRDNFGWNNHPLSSAAMEASFARPVVGRDGTYVFWQTTARDSGRIYILAPDTSVASPRITAANFTPLRASRSERARVTWNIPADTSGIYGFSWTWSQDANTVPPEQVMIYNIGNTSNLNLEHNASSDGEWFFSVRAQDFAGNWSEPAQIMYYRKSTPPPALTIIEPELDDNGFLLSNTFNMLWQPSTDAYVAGYTWNLQYLGLSAQTNENININPPPSVVMGASNSVSYRNQENGLWAFSVSAIDHAGNIGQPSNIIFRTNKFIPFTSVSYIDAQQDDQGVLSIRIIGRGFSTGGQISSIVLETDQRQEQSTGNFNILSDREISGIIFENINEGQYRLRLNHTGRGWYTADAFIPVARTGTVKFGDYSREWRPTWTIQNQGWLTFNPVWALVALLILFCALGMIATIRGIGGIITEGALVKQEALAILTGDFMPMEKKQKVVQIQHRRRGLRFKFASFTIGLILLVVIMISTPMYIIMTNTLQRTLLESLWDRSKVLLEGLASSTRTYMPMAIQSMGERGALELMFLPAQSSALPEANYITITGYGIGSIHTDHVWASNDPDIDIKLDTSELRRGTSRITDSLSPYYNEISNELNKRAQEAAGDLSQTIRELYDQGLALALRTDAEGERLRNDIQVTITSLEVKLNEILTGIAGDINSYPQFSTEKISYDETSYIFYKPVMYRQGADDNFYRGLIRLEVSLDAIIERIYQGQITILITIGIVALAVMLIGIIGAFTFSTLIIRPIKKLVKHIEIIRDTEDKAKLAGMDINIPTRDEIAILGGTINDMTQGLVKAALAASDLSIGKEIQKKFIPLDVDNHGNKQSSGLKKTPNLDFFGYYEGAKGVSGDYFDYKDLDGRYYAIIKCDVAGKGIPAALIMIQVATMFLNYFKQWKPNAKGMHIEEVVYQINDFIETLAFKGRFAAFTLCLFDSVTGIVRFCNAGDNIVRYYDASEKTIKTVTLPQTPATGVLPNFMIESTGGYTVQSIQIDKGDILFLYTDGIEEAKRRFRDSNFKEILCTEGPTDTPHENHLSGQADEEMGPDRVEAIINAVMAREVYTLKKFHNPEGEVELQFDFSTCDGQVEDVITAMVSVEKMFRCYKSPASGEESRVLVDKKVDDFLKNHFLQYRRYCLHTREYPENPAYMYYTHVMEDEQYDDLTILGIKLKEK
ncbi:MAG: SpoIIE family protein phosphatase [Treponema sp.]|nr:SpoIIE family protein phosphatase [Treponema sp.]